MRENKGAVKKLKRKQLWEKILETAYPLTCMKWNARRMER
jgi:hypothetical protein